jgi:hypothetical protein
MGKGSFRARVLFRPRKRGSKGRHGCFDCHRPIVYGDRCPDCAQQARAQAVNRKRRKRKPR